jgi:hypothetical protein
MGRYSSVNAVGFTKQVYFSSNAPSVPLLYDPTKIPGGWTGCVYARYSGTDPTADADLTLGTPTVNGVFWPGWEPMADKESDSQGGSNCYQAAWNNNQSFFSFPFTTIAAPTNWYKLTKPPRPNDQTHNDECSDCPSVGILPLTSNTSDVKTMITKLTAAGTTNAAQGLFWAYEVLMPGDPFNQAVVSPPFQRAQAIVLMTDGQSHGGNGDAYHGWFGAGDQSSDATDFGTMKMPVYDASCNLSTTNVDNNLGNRLLALATKVKGCDTTKGGPGQGPIKLYVIAYQQAGDTDLTPLLSAVATKPTTPYYFKASNGADLQNAFTQIGASLSSLRLIQ